MTRRPAMMRAGRRGRGRKEAEKRAGGYWVCLIGFSDIVPRHIGDNRGAVPVRVVTAKKDRTAAEKYDASQPIHRCEVLERVAVDTEEHAKRLKAAIDTILMGEVEAQRNDELRKQWVDVHGCFDGEYGRGIWWGIVLDQALGLVRQQASKFNVYGADRREGNIERARLRVVK